MGETILTTEQETRVIEAFTKWSDAKREAKRTLDGVEAADAYRELKSLLLMVQKEDPANADFGQWLQGLENDYQDLRTNWPTFAPRR